MLKILHIIPSLSKGGAERLVLDICNELSKRENITVTLITFSAQNEYPDLSQNIDWKVVNASIQLSLLKQNQFKIEKLQKAIDEYQPDIIHTHLFEAEIVSRTCYYPQSKWFSHCHSNMPEFNNFSFLTLTDKRLFTSYFEKKYLFKRYKINEGTHFIAISNDTKRYFEQIAKPYPVTLLHNAINYSHFHKQKGFNTISSKLRLVNTGSLIDRKNQIFLIDVAHVLKNRNIDFEIHLLGDGPNKQKIQDKIEAFSLSNKMILHGNVNNIEEYLWQSDIYVHSAYYEPLGLVLLEAMAAGLPVITLDGKGNRDLIKQGKNGFMLFEQNPKLFADKIIELWENKELYRRMSDYAVQFAKKFDIKPYTDKLVAFYRYCLKNNQHEKKAKNIIH